MPTARISRRWKRPAVRIGRAPSSCRRCCTIPPAPAPGPEPPPCPRSLSLAEQFGFAVVEDDVYGDLYAGPAVRLAQIDGLRHVIYVGSYSKLIGPALRVGFVAADTALISRLVERKVLTVLSGSALLECFVSEVLDGGRYKRHVDQVRARLARMRRDSRQALESAGIVFESVGGEG